MTPTMITKAREFREAYAELLRAWRAKDVPTLDQATAICCRTYRAEYNLLIEIVEEAAVCTDISRQPSFLKYLASQLVPVLDTPELFRPGTLERRPGEKSVPEETDGGMPSVVRDMLEEGVMLGKTWIDMQNPDSPLSISIISITLEWLGRWLESAKYAGRESPEAPAADTEAPEDNTRNIPRAQSIALLYAVFVRLGITQTHTDTAVARLIEAVTGGKIRDGKNSYAWKHRNDKLQPVVEALIDDFMNSKQSPK